MIDLHLHSNCSDGSDDLESLIDNIYFSGINCFALTDHDTAEGCRKVLNNENLQEKLKKYNIEFVSGAEWTCIYQKQKMHILAYNFNPFDERILNLEQKMRDMLDEKDRLRKINLEQMGFKLSQKSLDYLSSKENVRSMDFAKCLVEDGYFNELQQAFKGCLNIIKYPFECRFDACYILPILKECGAKVVWAHSIYDMKRKVTSYDEVERIIKDLNILGLDGLECYYSLYQKNEIETLVEIAKRNDLFVTCGSDYHGKSKSVKLGQFSANNDIDVMNIDKDKFKVFLENN